MGGDENNNWLKDTPSQGDKTPWQYAGGADSGINVRPDALTRFSNQALDEEKALRDNLEDGVRPLQAATSRIGGSFPFQEAAYFDGMQAQGAELFGKFTADAMKGTAALGNGARTIAATYVDGDATSAATMKDVDTAFTPEKGQGVAGRQPTGVNTGKAGESALPAADRKEFEAIQENIKKSVESGGYDPGGRIEDKTIPLGADASYTVPGRGTDDIESSNVQADLPNLG